MLVVGDQKEIDLGDGKHAVSSLEALAEGALREMTMVLRPLRDPGLTRKRPLALAQPAS